MQYEGNRLRHELKYEINSETYYVLRERLRNVMEKDPHMPDDEGYLISSIYFDDLYHSAIEEKMAGIRFRKKFRIRSYGRDPNLIRLECKSKYDEYIAKTSARLTIDEYEQILSGDYDRMLFRPEQVCKELAGFYRTKRLHPVVTVEYMREAYVSPMGNVRITFDKDLSASVETTDLFAEGFITTNVLPDDVMILEVKYDDYLPDSIRRILQTDGADQCAISKYVMCREEKRRLGYV